MILKIVSVKDLAAQAFMQPTFVHHEGLAVREFTDCINKSDHHFSRHPDDYELYLLGTFDDSDGVFICPKKPDLLVQGKNLVLNKN